MKLNNVEKAIKLAEQIDSLIKEYKKMLNTTMDEELYPLLEIYEKHWEGVEEKDQLITRTTIPNKHKVMWHAYEICCDLKHEVESMVYNNAGDFQQLNKYILKGLRAVSKKHKNKNLKIVK